MKVKLTSREPTNSMDRIFQKHLIDAKRTVDRLNKFPADCTPETAALIRQAESKTS